MRRRLTPALLAALLLAVALLAPAALGGDAFCKACGQKLEGSYISTGADTYHHEHFTCTICGQPLVDNYVVRDGKNYHPECYEKHVALKCDLCGKPIHGRYIQNFWGQAYHIEHREHEPQCDHCSRFISKRLTDGGWEYEDGRRICGICRKSAVKTTKEAEALLREAAGRLGKIGLDVDTKAISLHLVGLDDIRGLAGSSSQELRGYTDYNASTFLGITTRKEIDVYVLYGMPRESALGTMAHELMHVWQAERGRIQNDPAFSEGSCNYAAFLVLKEYETPQARFVLNSLRKSEDTIYGDGFRRVREFAEKEGVQSWIRQLANEDVLPSGY